MTENKEIKEIKKVMPGPSMKRAQEAIQGKPLNSSETNVRISIDPGKLKTKKSN